MIEPGGLEEGGPFNVLVSRNSRNSDANFYLKPRCASVYCSEAGKVECQCQFICFFCYLCPLFRSFNLFICFQLPPISWFNDLLEGVLSCNPLVRKSAFLAFDHFLIEPPLSLQHCIPVTFICINNANSSCSRQKFAFPICSGECLLVLFCRRITSTCIICQWRHTQEDQDCVNIGQ